MVGICLPTSSRLSLGPQKASTCSFVPLFLPLHPACSMSGSRRPRASTSLSTWPLVESPMFSTSGSGGSGAVDGQSPAAVIASVSTAALNSLQDLLDAANTLPCIKYVASVAVKILQTIDVSISAARERHAP